MSEAGLGAHFELGPVSLAAMAGLTSATQQLAKAQSDWIEQEKEYQRLGPVFVQMLASGTVDASSDPLILDLGGPASGRVYEVRQLVVGGLLWSTTVAGVGLVLVQPNSPPPNVVPGLGGAEDCASSLPSVAFYSSGQFRVMHPNHIYVVIIGGTASTTYQVAGDAFDVPNLSSKKVFDI
jgi:hypothetical protein